jgi:hypothetical protein
MGNFRAIAAAPGGTRRGGISDDDNDVPVYPVNFQLLPGYNLTRPNTEKSTNNLFIGLFVGIGFNLNGVGAAPIGLINNGHVHGIQASGTFNMAYGFVEGIQGSGTLNYAAGDFQGIQGSGVVNIVMGNVYGIQGAGVANYSRGLFKGLQAAGIGNYAREIQGAQVGMVNILGGDGSRGASRGAQFGLVNISESENIVPIGLVNIIKNGILHPAVFVDDMLISNLSFRSGSKNFYVILISGTDFGSSDENTAWLVSSRAGFGFEFPIKKIFIDIDAVAGSIYRNNADEMNRHSRSNTIATQLRLSAGYKIFEHFGIFGGVSYDHFYRLNDNSPNLMNFGFLPGNTQGQHLHKIGLFGGIQF